MIKPLKKLFSTLSFKKPLSETLTIPVTIKQTRPLKERPTVTPKVRVVFMGTPGLSAALLQALLDKEYNVVGVVTKPDKPVGRKKRNNRKPR